MNRYVICFSLLMALLGHLAWAQSYPDVTTAPNDSLGDPLLFLLQDSQYTTLVNGACDTAAYVSRCARLAAEAYQVDGVANFYSYSGSVRGIDVHFAMACRYYATSSQWSYQLVTGCASAPQSTPPPTPTATPSPTPSPTPSYSITKSVSGTSGTADALTMNPSVYSCGASPSAIQSAIFNFVCVQHLNGQTQSVDGCSIQYTYALGDNGGHSHSNYKDNERFGLIEEVGENQPLSIPAAGQSLTYATPEVSGGLTINWKAFDPTGRPIPDLNSSSVTVQIPGAALVDLDGGTTIDFDIASHPGDGFYATSGMQTTLTAVVTDFYAKAATVVVASQVPLLKSEAASLHWGGLFDANQTWAPPHCGHRLGQEVDLSLSVFLNNSTGTNLKNILASTIRRKGLEFPVYVESPNNATATHWHVRGK